MLEGYNRMHIILSIQHNTTSCCLWCSCSLFLYNYGIPDAFGSLYSSHETIDLAYIDRISITHGNPLITISSLTQLIAWTWAGKAWTFFCRQQLLLSIYVAPVLCLLECVIGVRSGTMPLYHHYVSSSN